MIDLPRRGLLNDIISLGIAPAIVRASSLMAINPIQPQPKGLVTLDQMNELMDDIMLSVVTGSMLPDYRFGGRPTVFW